jgi:hypothetical protein
MNEDWCFEPAGAAVNLDAEALPTATLAGNIGIAEAKGLIKALLYEIDLGSVDQGEAGFIDHELHAAILKDLVFVINLIRIIHDIGKSVTAGLLDTDPETDATAT